MNFADALDVKVEEIERPPLAPAGHYTWRVNKVQFGNAGQGAYDTIDYLMAAVSAEDDVDPEALAEAGGIGSVRVRNRFMFPTADDDEAKAQHQNTMFNMKRFLTEHLEVDGDGKTLKEAIDAAIGHQCLGELRHRPDKNNPDVAYLDLGRTAPVA